MVHIRPFNKLELRDEIRPEPSAVLYLGRRELMTLINSRIASHAGTQLWLVVSIPLLCDKPFEELRLD